MVSLFAAFKGSSSIAAGNIVGSNIANIALILGIAALLSPLVVARKTLTREIPMMIIASIAVFLLSLDGKLGFYDGLPLLLCLLIFVAYCVVTARHAPSESGLSIIGAHNYNLWKRDVFLIVLGIFCLGGGAELMVRGAVMIATILGISEVVIGLSIVAVGTSLPELAASMVSAWKGEMDISIGNVIGSNIFNVLFVLGLCPMLQALEIEERVLEIDFPIMLGFCVLLLALLLFVSPRFELDRKKGLMLLLAYLLFLIGLF